MDGREIPGFYFDPEKKKYFKIQKAHEAPRPDSKYSQANVAKEKKKEKSNKEATERSKQRRRETILRPNTNNFFFQASLDREIGHRRPSYYAHTMWPGACVSGFQYRSMASKQSVERQYDSLPDNAPMRFFDRDPVSKTLYIVMGEASVYRRRCNTQSSFPRPADDDIQIEFEPWDFLARMTSPVSSFNYLPASGALCVTTYGSDRPPVVYLTDPDRDGPHVGELFTPRSCTAIWDSAPRPSFSSTNSASNIPATSTETIAIGASSSLMLFTRSNSGTWSTSTPLQLQSDILALEWLSDTTLALGCRSGNIHLYDSRTNGSSHVLTHPYPISRIRHADHFTRLVCAGLDSTCMLYDMRMGRSRPPHHHSGHASPFSTPSSSNHNRKRKRRPHPNPSPSEPVLHFQHSNVDDLELDVAVHPRLGLVAAAQEDSRIILSNLWTGSVVKEFSACQRRKVGERREHDWRIRCLRFMDDGDGGGGGGNVDGVVSLWASWKEGVARFGW